MTHNDKARPMAASKNARLIESAALAIKNTFVLTEDEDAPEYFDNVFLMATYQGNEPCDCGDPVPHPALIGTGFVVGNVEHLRGALVQQMAKNPRMAEIILGAAKEFSEGREHVNRLFKGLENLFGNILVDDGIPSEQRSEIEHLLNAIKDRNSQGLSAWERRLKEMKEKETALRRKHNLEP